jgi:predicted nucleic acid-binding protein
MKTDKLLYKLRPNYFDASAMVKLVVEEEFSERVRSYAWQPTQSWRLCTSYCFVEAINVLKAKFNRKEISNRSYIAGSRRLAQLKKNGQVRLVQTDFSFLDSFHIAEDLVRLHAIDFLDAFQLMSVNNSWSNLASSHKPLLITADSKLAQAAEKEGIQAWLCRDTPSPKC